MRVLALALLAAALLLVPSAAATPSGPKLLVHEGSHLTLVGQETVAAGSSRPLAFSGDGRLVSIGGRIVDHVTLPAKYLVWAPTGERAAYVTTSGTVVLWTPTGKRRIEPKGWGADWYFGASGLAWSADGSSLAIGRGAHIWVWSNGVTREVAGTAPLYPGTGGRSLAVPFAWSGNRVLWWAFPGSGSVASDGVSLYEGTTLLGTTLMYRDYSVSCGSHVAFVEGSDRESMDNKKIVFDGRDVSNDRTRSWSTPACTTSGRLVAAASRNIVPSNTTETHRAIWQLLPIRKQLTRPPWGWSDEDPHLFANGDMLFVRTRSTSKKTADGWNVTQTGRVMLLSHGKLTELTQIGFTEDQLSNANPIEFYGHYDWSHQLAVWP